MPAQAPQAAPPRSQPAALVVDADWSRGQIRDAPRGSIPDGGVYNSVDFLLHRPGLAQKRGGTTYAGPALTGAGYCAAVGYAPQPGNTPLVAIGDNGHAYLVSSGSATDKGAMGTEYIPVDTPKYWVGEGSHILVITANDGTSSPKKIETGTIGTLGGSPPAGKYAAVYKGRLVLGNSSANPDRIYFSDVPSIEDAWDTTNSWVNTEQIITGMAALQNMLIIFSDEKTKRITGTTPPPDTDFDMQPVGDVGCLDARSIVVYQGNAIFANQRAVWSTNGSTFQNLTQVAGNETYWQSLFDGYDRTTWTVAAGIFASHLYVSVMNGATIVDTLVFNLARPSWWRTSNIAARMFANVTGGPDELYYADRVNPRVVAIGDIYTPSAANKADANGTAVTPLLETRLLGGGPTLKAFGHCRISMDMRDAATDNPEMTLSVAPGLEATSFAAVHESPLLEKVDSKRYRVKLGKVTQGVTLRFQQRNASAKTEIYGIEIDTRPLPYGAGGPY